jgi:hypothetical protein
MIPLDGVAGMGGRGGSGSGIVSAGRGAAPGRGGIGSDTPMGRGIDMDIGMGIGMGIGIGTGVGSGIAHGMAGSGRPAICCYKAERARDHQNGSVQAGQRRVTVIFMPMAQPTSSFSSRHSCPRGVNQSVSHYPVHQ